MRGALALGLAKRELCGVALVVALLGAGAAASAAPPGARARRPATPEQAAARPAAAKPAPTPVRKPIDVATQARAFEEQGNYASALTELKLLRSMQGPDADVELMLALDEARVGLADSAWARFHAPLLSAALADTAGVARRTACGGEYTNRFL